MRSIHTTIQNIQTYVLRRRWLCYCVASHTELKSTVMTRPLVREREREREKGSKASALQSHIRCFATLLAAIGSCGLSRMTTRVDSWRLSDDPKLFITISHCVCVCQKCQAGQVVQCTGLTFFVISKIAKKKYKFSKGGTRCIQCKINANPKPNNKNLQNLSTVQ